MPHLSGMIVSKNEVIEGEITFDTHISAIRPRKRVPRRWILPGFIDTHVHGGDGVDIMDGDDAILRIARFHLRHGTTSFVPTTLTRPWAELKTALDAIARVMRYDTLNGAQVCGAHLEGPFVNGDRRGAQPNHVLAFDQTKVEAAIALGVLRSVTLAPELAGARDAIDAFCRAKVAISIGHTNADYETMRDTLALIDSMRGKVGVTHVFNAMPPILARSPGPIVAAMQSRSCFCEVILDKVHVHPANFQLLASMKQSRLMLITDAIAGCGLLSGKTSLGGQEVNLIGGAARLNDGTLAGSLLTMDQAFRNAIELGSGVVQAARYASTNPARFLGLRSRGVLTEGREADIVVMDDRFRIHEVWRQGCRRF